MQLKRAEDRANHIQILFLTELQEGIIKEEEIGVLGRFFNNFYAYFIPTDADRETVLKDAYVTGERADKDIRSIIAKLKQDAPDLVAALEEHSERYRQKVTRTPYTVESIPLYAEAMLTLNKQGIPILELQK